jgi:hypothetical protein
MKTPPAQECSMERAKPSHFRARHKVFCRFKLKRCCKVGHAGKISVTKARMGTDEGMQKESFTR